MQVDLKSATSADLISELHRRSAEAILSLEHFESVSLFEELASRVTNCIFVYSAPAQKDGAFVDHWMWNGSISQAVGLAAYAGMMAQVELARAIGRGDK